MSEESKNNERELIVMIGMSFSGKTYHVDFNYLPKYQLISLKHLKQALKTTRISNEDFIYACMDLVARSYMIKELPIVVDESNLDIDSIFLWKKLTREFGYNLKGVFIDTPLDVCTARLKYALNGDKITEKMHEKLATEYDKVEELKQILKMKHQSVVDNVVFITYDGG